MIGVAWTATESLSRLLLTVAIHYGTILCAAVLLYKHLFLWPPASTTDQCSNINLTTTTSTTAPSRHHVLLQYVPYSLMTAGLVVGSVPIIQVGILWLSFAVAYDSEAVKNNKNNELTSQYYMPSKECTEETIQNAMETLTTVGQGESSDEEAVSKEQQVAQVLSDIAKWTMAITMTSSSSSVQQQTTTMMTTKTNHSILFNSELFPRIILSTMKQWKTSQLVRQNGCWALLACLISRGDSMIFPDCDDDYDDNCNDDDNDNNVNDEDCSSSKASLDTNESSQYPLKGNRLLIMSTDTETEMELEIPVIPSYDEMDPAGQPRRPAQPRREESKCNITVISNRVAMNKLEEALNEARNALHTAKSKIDVLVKEKTTLTKDSHTKLQENKANIDRLLKCQESTNKSLDGAKETIISLQHEKSAALADAKNTIEKKEKQIAELETSLRDTRIQLDELQNRLASVEEENARVIDEMKIDLLESQAHNARLTISLKETKSALQGAEQTFIELKEKGAKSETSLLECKAENAQLTTSLAETKFTLDKAKLAISENSAALFVAQHELLLNEACIQDLTKTLKESSRMCIPTKEMDETKTAKSATTSMLHVDEKDKQIAELESTLTDMKKELNDLKNRLTLTKEGNKVVLSNMEANLSAALADNEQLRELPTDAKSALLDAEEKIARLSKDNDETKDTHTLSLKENLKKAMTDLAEARTQLISTQSRQDEMKEDLLASQAENDELTCYLSKTKSALQGAEQSINDLKEQNVIADNNLSQQKVENTQLIASLDETKAALERAKQTVSEFEGKGSAALCVAQQELQLSEARIHDLQKMLEETSRDFDSYKKEMTRDLESKTMTVSQTEMRLETSQALIQELEEALAKARDSLQSFGLKFSTLEKNHTKNIESLHKKLSGKEKENAELSKALADLTSALIESRNEIFTIQEEPNVTLQRELNFRKNEVVELQASLTRAQSDSKSAREKIQELENERSALVEASEKLVESESFNLKLRQALESALRKAQADNEATCQKMQEIKNEVVQLQASLARAQSDSKAARDNIQELENEKSAAFVEATEKPTQSESFNLKLRQALESALRKAQADNAAACQKMQEIENEVVQLQASLARAQSDSKAAREKIQELENEKSALVEASEKLVENESFNLKLQQALESALLKAQADNEATCQKMQEIENEKSGAIAEANEKLVEMKQTLEDTETTVSALQCKLSETQSRLKLTESKNQQLQKTTVDLNDELPKAQFELELSEAYVSELKNVLQNVTVALKDAQQQIMLQQAGGSSTINEANQMLERVGVNVLELECSLAKVALHLDKAHKSFHAPRTEEVVEMETLSETQRELERSQVQIIELTIALAESTAALEDSRERITELEDSEQQMTFSLHQKLETSSAEVELLRNNILELSVKLKNSQGRVAKLENAEKKVQHMQKQLDCSRLEIGSLTAALKESISALENAQGRIIELEQEKANALQNAEVRLAISNEAIGDLKVSLAEIIAIVEAEDQVQLDEMCKKNNQTESTSNGPIHLDEAVGFAGQKDEHVSNFNNSSLKDVTCSLNGSRTDANTMLLSRETKEERVDFTDVITSLTDATTDLSDVREKIDASKWKSLENVQEMLVQRKQKIAELNSFLIQLTAALVKAQERIWVLEGSKDSESKYKLVNSVQKNMEERKQGSSISSQSNRRRRQDASPSPIEAQRDVGKLILNWLFPSFTPGDDYSDSIDVLFRDLEPIMEESDDSSKDSLLNSEVHEVKTNDFSTTENILSSLAPVSTFSASSIFCQCWDYDYHSDYNPQLAQKSELMDELKRQVPSGSQLEDMEHKCYDAKQAKTSLLHIPINASNIDSAIKIQFNENFETNKQQKEERSDAEFEIEVGETPSKEQEKEADVIQRPLLNCSSLQEQDTAVIEEREPSFATCFDGSSESPREQDAETKTDDSQQKQYFKSKKTKLPPQTQQVHNPDYFPSQMSDGYLSEKDIPASSSTEAIDDDRSFSSFEFLCRCAGWNEKDIEVLKHHCDDWNDEKKRELADTMYYPIVVGGSSTSEDSSAESCVSQSD